MGVGTGLVREQLQRALGPSGMREPLHQDFYGNLLLARGGQRARAAGAAGPDSLIIAADTVVALGGDVLGKPHSENEAFAMLSALSGREHHVYTGLTVLQRERVVTVHEETAVLFRDVSPDEIRSYIATGEPMDKAGAYGIQGVGALLVSGIRGDYCNVMGLPVFRLGRILREFGVDLLRRAEPS